MLDDIAIDDDTFDIELKLLVEAIYLKYHYDFREYAVASLKRRLAAAMPRLECETISQIQDNLQAQQIQYTGIR